MMPGEISLHSCIPPHGTDNDAFEKCHSSTNDSVYLDNTMSFMFETRLPQMAAEFTAKDANLQDDNVDRLQGRAEEAIP